MSSLDISALANQCRVTPEAIYQILEDLQVLLDTPETINSNIVVGGSSALPAVSTMVIDNDNTEKTLYGIILCAASVVITVTAPSMVAGHKLFRDGVDIGQHGLFGGEPGWNAIFAASDDRVLPLICAKIDVPPSTSTSLVHTVDINAAFTTGTASATAAESRTMVFIGGY